ncbi:TRAP transporter small permease subunit [Pollutimonas harenae]|uniref:TRAP transporter small permease protein n=1 Tax=Pollutimonas harenae TaxID=657015 RepID=A0A853H2K1_9BURK|nr:TRAP transporter small permease subunit [Pollutimonas harenae]NYT84803.1 TRAP transporter small permease subunit [Pollutimonas harenae]TEA72798.1 TRAP transporter small permease subunit [Pollutimonas harenae]
MHFLLQLSRLIDRVMTAVGKAAGWLVLAAVIISAGNAVVRKVFSTSSNAWLDAQWYLFGAVFMLCASYTLLKNGHVRVDLLMAGRSKRTRDLVDVFGHAFFLIPLSLLMIYESYPFAMRSMELGETSPNAGGLPVWPAKMLILVGFILLLIQAVSELIKRIAILRGQLEDPDSRQDDIPELVEALDVSADPSQRP